ncbi:MAG: hypothetical protein HY721_02320 [Planctomycetes bacterium]|nr:hypothetical protein [Planctomycetota bacterium]
MKLIKPVLLLAGLVTAGARAQEGGPSFSLTFSLCDAAVKAAPGRTSEWRAGAVLVTASNPDPAAGAQGWSISLSAEGVEITGITTSGTLAAKVTDDPPGLLDGGFEKSEIAHGGTDGCEDRDGAVSAVVLAFVKPVTLPPAGAAPIARITFRGRTPAELGQARAARLFFLDGCGGSG